MRTNRFTLCTLSKVGGWVYESGFPNGHAPWPYYIDTLVINLHYSDMTCSYPTNVLLCSDSTKGLYLG